MTSLRDAYPQSAPPPPSMEPHGMPDLIPHGAPGGAQAGGMDSKLPFKQMSGNESMESYLRQVQTESPQHQYQQQQEAAAMQYRRQQAFQAQAAAAESKMRSIAQQETKWQAAGFVAMGMCVVFVAIFIVQMRGKQ